MRLRAPQRGVILISMLVLVALATVVAAGLFFETALAARRAESSLGMEEALQLTQGAEALAAYALSQDTNQTDTPQDDWAQPTEPMEVTPDVSLQGQLLDLQGKFNINTLVGANGVRDENAYKVFVRLLELLQIDTGLADMVVDWIDPDSQATAQGAEDSLYMSQDPPHLAANLAITSTSELLQIPGMNREIFARLKPHIAALPPSVRTINVCMADGFVLDALYALSDTERGHVEYSLLTPDQFTQQRAGDCFPRRNAIAAGVPAMLAMTAERTSWFQLQTFIHVGTAEFDLYSLMYRAGRQARAVMRSLGTD